MNSTPIKTAEETIEIIFRHPETKEEKILNTTLEELLNKSIEDFYEDLDQSEPCTSASCNNESQNFCDCGSYYEDFEFLCVRISEPFANQQVQAKVNDVVGQMTEFRNYCNSKKNIPLHLIGMIDELIEKLKG